MKAKKMIVIDLEVYSILCKLAKGFETPNAVLRRVFDLVFMPANKGGRPKGSKNKPKPKS